MQTEAAGAGFYQSPLWGKSFARLQIRTVEELLNGRGFEYPSHAASTWKQAGRVASSGEQEALTF